MASGDGWEDVPVQASSAHGWEDVPVPAQPKTGAISTVVHHGLQGLTQGFSDELGGLGTSTIQGLVNILPKSVQDSLDLVPASTRDAYQFSRDEERKLLKQQEAEHKGLANASQFGGSVLGGLALPAGGAGLGGAAISGGLQGALYGAGTSEADLLNGDVGGLIADTGKGLVGGAAGGVAGYGVAKGLGAGAKLVGRGAKAIASKVSARNPAVQQLLDAGVPLTVGQMNPGGVMSKLEEAGMHSALGGEQIAAARQAAREGFQDAALNGTRPVPGALGPGDVADKLERIYGEFETAYEPIRAENVQALARTGKNSLAPIDQALQDIANDKSIYATAADRDAARDFFSNLTTPEQLGLQAAQPGGSVPLTKADALLNMRSELRKQLRAASKAGDPRAMAFLEKAEEAVTGGLEAQLSPESMQQLAATDTKYRQFKQVADAVVRSGDQPNGFTPSHLSSAVKTDANKMGYAMGAGGPNRDLAAAGKEVLDARQPPTGAKLLTLPFGLNHAAGPAALAANSGAGKAVVAGAQKTLAAAAKPFAAMGKVGQLLSQNSTRLGKFGTALSAIHQQHGPEAAAAAHFVMSQTNPEYQQLAKNVNEGRDPDQP